eukprot:221125-Pelagomonas_calceolata.AAC.1
MGVGPGGVEAIMQQVNPKFHDSGNVLPVCDIQGGSSWTCKPVVGAWQGRRAWASAAQFLSHNSAATHFSCAVSMQMDGGSNKMQIGTLIAQIGGLECFMGARGFQP